MVNKDDYMIPKIWVPVIAFEFFSSSYFYTSTS